MLQAFTEAVIVPSCGYTDVENSWDASNGLRWIPTIETPTLLVSARDDPFLAPECALALSLRLLLLLSCQVAHDTR